MIVSLRPQLSGIYSSWEAVTFPTWYFRVNLSREKLAWPFSVSLGKFVVCWWYGCWPNSHLVNVVDDCMFLVCRPVCVYQRENFNIKERVLKVFEPYNYYEVWGGLNSYYCPVFSHFANKSQTPISIVLAQGPWVRCRRSRYAKVQHQAVMPNLWY